MTRQKKSSIKSECASIKNQSKNKAKVKKRNKKASWASSLWSEHRKRSKKLLKMRSISLSSRSRERMTMSLLIVRQRISL